MSRPSLLSEVLARRPVPEGWFAMGSVGRRADEAPQHRVFVSRFEMAETPVTNEQYGLYLESTGAEPPPWFHDSGFARPQQPVVGVSWFEATAYCRWLARQSGLDLRLPTEAEREKAARGGTDNQRFPWGDDPTGGGHDRLRGPLEGPEDVGCSSPNGFGLFNTADTVHEWCLDGYDPRFYHRSPAENPCASPTTRRRSARGGSWRHYCVVSPCSARSSLPPSFQYNDFGFRWVRPAPGTGFNI